MNQSAPAQLGSPSELFALTDEQILDIVPEPAESEPVGQPFLTVPPVPQPTGEAAAPVTTSAPSASSAMASATTIDRPATTAQPQIVVPPEPPPWLAAQMKDPWTGTEAQEFWNGVQQAKSEAAAYREAIATPEDARALKELYPGGITEARTAAERARQLDEIDRAYFGGAGNSPEQTSAARVQLAQRLSREDPRAFREMLDLGLRMLQQASDAPSTGVPSSVGAQSAAADAQLGTTSANETHVAAYAAFERAANEDLERSVGAAIERTLAQALPVAQPILAEQRIGLASGKTAQPGVPALRQRLSTAIRHDLERMLQGDRQLGEQVAQVLASRRFDTDARAQVVRLITDRAQQLVPGAAKRVLNDWTQTTLAAHRTRSQRNDSSASADITPASPELRAASAQRAATSTAQSKRPVIPSEVRNLSSLSSRRLDYRKLSDEQILDM